MGRASREQWAKRVEKWSASGLTAEQFACKHGISVDSLKWWKWALGSGRRKVTARRRQAAKLARSIARVPPLSFVEMTIADRKERVDLELPKPETPLELVLPDGLYVRIREGFSSGALVQLLDVLDKRR